MNPTSSAPWWGEHFLPAEGRSLLLQLGPFWLAATTTGASCRLVWSSGRDPLGTSRALSTVEADTERPPGPRQEIRVAAGGAARTLRLTPRLAPRPFVSRPVGSVVLPPDATLDAFVSTPLWLGVGVPTESLDLPTQLPNETWFGPDTVSGELCFSGRTVLRTELEALDLRPHRAVTPVRVVNRRSTPLTIRRIRIPTPALPLFMDTQGTPWTPRVTLTVEAAGELAVQDLAAVPPEEVAAAVPVSVARQPPAAGLVSRAVRALLP